MDWENPFVGVTYVIDDNYHKGIMNQYNFLFKNGDESNAKMPGKPRDWNHVNISPEDSQVRKVHVYVSEENESNEKED